MYCRKNVNANVNLPFIKVFEYFMKERFNHVWNIFRNKEMFHSFNQYNRIFLRYSNRRTISFKFAIQRKRMKADTRFESKKAKNCLAIHVWDLSGMKASCCWHTCSCPLWHCDLWKYLRVGIRMHHDCHGLGHQNCELKLIKEYRNRGLSSCLSIGTDLYTAYY